MLPPMRFLANHRLKTLESDETKIQNRISLLKVEEKKMMKKIVETKEQAQKIMKIKLENEQRFVDKVRYRAMELERIRQLQEANRLRRKQDHMRRELVRESIHSYNRKQGDLERRQEQEHQQILSNVNSADHEAKYMSVQLCRQTRENHKRVSSQLSKTRMS